jgi:hypothetical protein
MTTHSLQVITSFKWHVPNTAKKLHVQDPQKTCVLVMTNVCRVQFVLDAICEKQKENEPRKHSSVANLYTAISDYINFNILRRLVGSIR